MKHKRTAKKRTRGQMQPKRNIRKDAGTTRPKTRLEKTCAALTAAFALTFSGGAMSTMVVYAVDTTANEELTLAPRPLARDIIGKAGATTGIGLAGMFGMALAHGAAADRRRNIEQAQYAATIARIKDALKPSRP